MIPARRKAQGFPLIEVMVAVSLLGVLLVLLFGAMRTGIRSWQAAERRIEATEGVVQAERFLVRVVSQAWSPEEAARGGRALGGGSVRGPRGFFEGARDRFALVAPGVRALPRSGLYRYEIYLEERAGDQIAGDLWVRMEPYRLEEEAATGEPRLLLENIAALEIRYFGASGAGGEPEWGEEWPADAHRLPLLVEIRLQPADAPERPLIIAAPMTAEGA